MRRWLPGERLSPRRGFFVALLQEEKFSSFKQVAAMAVTRLGVEGRLREVPPNQKVYVFCFSFARIISFRLLSA